MSPEGRGAPVQSPVPDRAVLRLEGLRKRYARDRPAVLDGIDLELRRENTSPSWASPASGNPLCSTCSPVWIGPDSGRVLLEGIDTSTLDDDGATLLRRRSVGFVFQAFHVLPYLTVEQNVALLWICSMCGNPSEANSP